MKSNWHGRRHYRHGAQRLTSPHRDDRPGGVAARMADIAEVERKDRVEPVHQHGDAVQPLGRLVLAVLGLRHKKIRLEEEPFTIPGGQLVPWLAVAAILVLLSTIKGEEFRAVGYTLGVASLLYVVRAVRGKQA